MKNLLSYSNAKIQKSIAFGYLTAILHLAPARLSGFQVCPKASIGCTEACLNTSGRSKFDNVQTARVEKTLAYFNDRERFMKTLFADISAAERKAKKAGLKLAIRINGTSDIPNLAFDCAKAFPEIQFYDYTKISKTFFRPDLPSNYHLTFSRSESNDSDVKRIVDAGFNVAVVFAGELPKTYLGRPVVDGDINDLRFLDPKGVIVGLSAKGKAKKDDSGFVVSDHLQTRPAFASNHVASYSFAASI